MPRMKHYTRYPVEYFRYADVADTHEPENISVPSAGRANSIRTELYNLRLSLRKGARDEGNEFPYSEVLEKFERLRFAIRPSDGGYTVRIEPIGYEELLNG